MTLNEQIQDAIKNYSSAASTVSARYADQPSFETQTRAQIMGGDTALPQLASGFSDKVMELYNYDKTKNASMNMPTTVPGQPTMTTQAGQEMTLNPMIQERAQQAGFQQTLQEKEKAWQLYEGRKNVLGDALDKAVKLYETKTKMKESERNAAKDMVTMLQDLYEEENRKSEALAKTSGGLSEYGLSDEDIKNLDTTKLNDSDAVAMAKQIYGPNVKLGTQGQAPSYARNLIENYKKNGYDLQVLGANMDAETKDRFLGALKFIPDAQKVIDNLKSDTLGTSLGDITSGPLASIIGPISGQSSTSPEMVTRQLLDQMRAEKIKEFYGGAFTTTEMQNAKWLPGSQRQEYKNLTALTAMQKSAYDKVKGALALLGISGPAADKVIQDELAKLNLTSGGTSDETPTGRVQP